jgi:DNA-binding CsgD family transcriptional regulator
MPKGRHGRQRQAEIPPFRGGSSFTSGPSAAITYFIWHAIKMELGHEFPILSLGCRKQITCLGHEGQSVQLLGLRSAQAKTRDFPPKVDIHGELGSVHAMNFGRSLKHLEVRSDSDAKRCRARSTSAIHNCPILGPESFEPRSLDQGEAEMNESSIRLGPREQQIAELLLQGCDNSEIARQLKMARRTVKAHFNRLFLRFAITGGIKRVKLATILYRRQLCSENSVTETERPASANGESLNSSPRDLKTAKSRMPSARQNTSSRTISESSMTSSGSGTGSNLPSGMKPADRKSRRTPEVLESWEQNILNLHQPVPRRNHLQR